MRASEFYLNEIWKLWAGIDDEGGAAANNAHLGQVGGEMITLQVQVAPQAAAYATGDLIGELLTIAPARVSGRGVILQTVAIADKAKQNSVIDIIVFRANPTNTTFTDNDPLNVDDADLDKIAGVVKVSNYADFSASSVGYATSVGLAIEPGSGQNLWLALVSRSTPTYASTNDIVLVMTFLQD